MRNANQQHEASSSHKDVLTQKLTFNSIILFEGKYFGLVYCFSYMIFILNVVIKLS